MARDLTTGWKRIGRSGPAVDGREIKPEMIVQAAANYNKDLFTALIWPEHFRYINLGTVEELRAADNEEGGKDLFAKISPNQFYLQANSAGQKLFTSMELTPDFRKTGQWYLTGLGATDDPASAATTEMRLSASAKPGAFLAKSVEHADHNFNDPSEPSFLKKIAAALFTNPTFEDEDMADKSAIDKLKADMDALQQKFAALKPEDKKEDKKPEASDDEQFTKLADKLAAVLAEKFGKKEEEKPSAEDEQFNKMFERLVPVLTEKFSKKPEGEGDKNDKSADDLKTLQTQFKALSDKLEAALKEQPGTDAGEHFGSGDKADNYL